MVSIKRFQAWLSRYPKGREAFVLIGTMFFLDVFWQVAVVVSINWINPLIIEQSRDLVGVISLLTFFLIPINAGLEEIIFRIIPLKFALRRWGVTWPTLVITLISSIIFGFAHGDLTHTASNIGHVFAQGFSGLAYAIVFIKFSHFGKYTKRAGWIVVGMHTAFDLLLGGVVFLLS